MRQFMTSLLVSLVTVIATPASADCTAEIKSLFQGGQWDPFVVSNRRTIVVNLHPDGSTTPSSDVIWDGPFRSINCDVNGCHMGIKNSSWEGPTFDGPWTKSNDKGIKDFDAFVRDTSELHAASVQDAECPGTTELNGKSAILYRFFSKPDPNEFGSWWGGQYTYWVDVETNRVMRMEISDGIASWAPKPTKDIQVMTVIYDDSIRVIEPK